MNIIDQLAKELGPALAKEAASKYGIGLKHDATGTPIASGYSHGPGGNFSYPGVAPDVFHTAVGNRGILGQLPTTPSVFTNPTFQVLTGVQDATGNEKDTVCENAPQAGLIKSCMLTSVFGRYERATLEIELNRLGQRNDRADPMDLTLVGSPIHQSGIFASGPQNPEIPGDLLTNELSRKFWELAVAIHRQISVQLWTGNPTNNSGGGGYKELTGFQLLVNTGHLDAETGTACPSIDSDLKDFNYGRIDVAPNGDNLVEALSYLLHTRIDLAERTGVMPVRWVFVMRSELFWELTAIYPCSYLTYRCQVTGQERVNIDANDAIRFRDEMRSGKFLLIDGTRYDVILDDGIPEATATTNQNVTEGCFASDVYLIPMSVVGGRAVTFMEYMDYGNPSMQAAIANMVLARQEGAFLTWPRQTNQCVVWQTKVEPRLIMRTPWLAGRLQNVMYCPLQHTRQPFPDDPYHVDGGRTKRPGPSFFSLWNPAGA